MKTFDSSVRATLALLIAACVTLSCASSEVSSRRRYYGDEKLSKPGRIIVHNFAASPADLTDDTAISASHQKRSTPQTAEEIRLGRQLGDTVAQELVKEILELGMPAERANTGSPPNVGDLLIKGAFISIDEGSRVKRMLIGFGAGSAELKTHVEVYQITAQGPRRLGEGDIKDSGGKMPGILVPVGAGAAAHRAGQTAVVAGGMNVGQEMGPESLRAASKRTAQEIAEALSKAFAKQGWIPAHKGK